MGGMIGVLAATLLGQCGYGGAHAATTYTYAAPTYQTYSYQQSYAQPYVQQQVITKYVAVQPYVDYTALAGDYVRAEKQLAERKGIEDQVAKLAGAVDQLRQIVVTTGTQPQPQQAPIQQAVMPVPTPQQYQNPTPQYAPMQTPTPAPQYQAPAPQFAPAPAKPLPLAVPPKQDPYPGGGVPPPPRVSAVSYGGQVSSLPAALSKCTACHTGPSSRGGIAIFSAPGQLAPLSADELEDIDKAVISGRMPKPPNPPLSLAEYGELKAWLLRQPTSGSGSRAVVSLNPF